MLHFWSARTVKQCNISNYGHLRSSMLNFTKCATRVCVRRTRKGVLLFSTKSNDTEFFKIISQVTEFHIMAFSTKCHNYFLSENLFYFYGYDHYLVFTGFESTENHWIEHRNTVVEYWVKLLKKIFLMLMFWNCYHFRLQN